jgi:thioredoxin 1
MDRFTKNSGMVLAALLLMLLAGCEPAGNPSGLSGEAEEEDVVTASAHDPIPLLLPVDLKDRDWLQQEVVDSPIPVVLEFGATWCGPCRLIAPILDEFQTKQAGNVKVIKIDVDEKPHLATYFKADGIPLVLIIHRGEVVSTMAGVPPGFDYKTLLAMVQPHMTASATPGAAVN